jgi:hypothetical protein
MPTPNCTASSNFGSCAAPRTPRAGRRAARQGYRSRSPTSVRWPAWSRRTWQRASTACLIIGAEFRLDDELLLLVLLAPDRRLRQLSG